MNETQARYQQKALGSLQRLEAVEQNMAKFLAFVKSMEKFTTTVQADLNTLQQTMNAIIKGTNEQFGTIGRQLSNIHTANSVLIGLAGKDKFDAGYKEQTDRELAEKIKKDEQGIQEMLKDGILVPGVKVGPGCLIGGLERTKDGTLTYPGTLYVPFESIKPDVQQQLVEKGIGSVGMLAGDGGSFEVTHVFQFIEKNLPALADPPPPEQSTVEGTVKNE